MTRIALIHALRHSVAPIEDAFKRLWPDAILMNLLDDSLSADLKRDGELTARMFRRFETLSRYAKTTGADGILFTCSAFAPCIDACAHDLAPLPVLRPTEALVAELAEIGKPVGLLATFEPTLRTLPSEFPPHLQVSSRLACGALGALELGDVDEHDRRAAFAADDWPEAGVIALAQFSLARAADAVRARTGKQVLTTPDSAVTMLKRLLT